MQVNDSTTNQFKNQVVNFATVWAAAAYAQRINGAYLKNPVMTVEATPIVQHYPNNIVMRKAFDDPSLLIADDFSVGKAARDFHLKKLTFKSLANNLAGFDLALLDACKLEDFDIHNDKLFINVIASQIQGYQNEKRVEDAQKQVDDNGPPLGEVGAMISRTVEIVKAVWSQNYNVYFMNALTDDKKMVFFSYRERLLPGTIHKIKGTIKKINPDIVQLNRVKLLDK